MPQSINVATKKKGRPSGRVQADWLRIRASKDLLSSLAAWIAAQPDPKPSRSDAVRALIALGIKASGRENGE